MKKRVEELRNELEATNAELENVKRAKETTEQELKGCEVELSLNETSIQTLEVFISISLTFHFYNCVTINCSSCFLNLIYPLQARISVLQGEIASIGSELDSLKVLS